MPRRRRGGEGRDLLEGEKGTIRKDAPLRVALVYPSPYRVAMASLGYQTLYRLLNDLDGVSCERATLESPTEAGPLRTLETGRPVSGCALVGLSVATEAEVGLAARALLAAGLPPLEEERRGCDDLPVVVAGGPLTFADGEPLAAIADVVLWGEAEGSLRALALAAAGASSRSALLEAAAALTGAVVPALGGPSRAERAEAARAELPAFAAIVTERSELGDMFLVEPARGCPNRCAFCVMERTRVRYLPASEVFARLPAFATRVGLVGSAIGGHPELKPLVRSLVEEGLSVSLSSLRADRLDGELLELLVAGGLRSLTVAADGPSERQRARLRKRVTAADLVEAARLAAAAGLRSVKLYAMVGLPDEEEPDLAELAALAAEMAESLPVALAVSPFVPKLGTSLEAAPFAGAPAIKARLATLRRLLRGRVELRPASVRAAWLENAVARGGLAAGRAAAAAAAAGCTHEAWRAALAAEGLEPA